ESVGGDPIGTRNLIELHGETHTYVVSDRQPRDLELRAVGASRGRDSLPWRIDGGPDRGNFKGGPSVLRNPSNSEEHDSNSDFSDAHSPPETPLIAKACMQCPRL